MFSPWEYAMIFINKGLGPRQPGRTPPNLYGPVRVGILLLLLISGCRGTADDLFPSGEDDRSQVAAGEFGGRPGNLSPDFALITTDNGTFTLSEHLAGAAEEADATVLYFTMWCPVCTAHMDLIQFDIMPRFSGAKITYLAVDYLSGSTENTKIAQQDAGFAGGAWRAAADPGQVVTAIYNATMGTTVVIDRDGIVRMNEDLRTGENLVAILNELNVTP
jgi:peroxiredoxin